MRPRCSSNFEPRGQPSLPSVTVVERVLVEEAAPGFQTPSKIYGPDVVLGLDSIVRADE